jgi:hypothetical protein
MAVPLAVFASIGAFARYTADDFCWAGVLRTEGFARAQMLWYTGYSPRYAFTFLVNLVELAGPAIVPALPGAATVVAVATTTWTLRQLDRRPGARPRLTAVVLAEILVLGTLATAPDLPQSLYWQTGMLTYLLPLVLATLLIGWIWRGGTAWWELLISGVITYVAGGLSETYLVPQNVAITLSLVVALLLMPASDRRTSLRLHLSAALAGGVLALITILVAPATEYRVGGTPANLWLASSAAIATGGVQLLRLVRYFPLVVLLCLGVPSLLDLSAWRISARWLAIVSALVVLTLPFCYFPSFYAQNGNPPMRSLIVPGAIMIGYLVFVGVAARAPLRAIPRPARRGLAVAAAAIPLAMAVVTLPERALAAEAATRFDATDLQIRADRAAGLLDITVDRLPRYLGENFVSSDRGDWFNVCVARYYDVRSIAAR